jgi:hypothetical protein
MSGLARPVAETAILPGVQARAVATEGGSGKVTDSFCTGFLQVKPQVSVIKLGPP